MEKSKLITGAVIIILVVILYKACSFSINSESSCKKTLCKGFWSYESNGEPLISKNGNYIFKNDGTCQYCTMGGMSGNQTNGTWKLGEVVKVTKKISYRIVNVSVGGSNYEFQLYADRKSYLSNKNTSEQYFHFDDNSKPIN